MERQAIVLLSGGLDSMVCAGIALERYEPRRLIALNMLYGQRHSKERQAASNIAQNLGIHYHELELPASLFNFGSLSGDEQVPEAAYEDFAPEEVNPTYVPFRNGCLLSLATAAAVSWGASEIYYGAHAGSTISNRWPYPDCTPAFNKPLAEAIHIGTYGKVELKVPLQWHTKKHIVAKAVELGLPIKLTWSCYTGGEKQCGKCATCLERIGAFKGLGIADPVPYEMDIDWGVR